MEGNWSSLIRRMGNRSIGRVTRFGSVGSKGQRMKNIKSKGMSAGGFHSMRKFAELFKKVGGFRILRQYARGRVLFYAIMITAVNGFSKKALEIVRLSLQNRLLGRLRKKYRKFVHEYLAQTEDGTQEAIQQQEQQKQQRKVWVCWFQGLDTAPEIVKRCYASLRQYITDREIVLLTEQNYRDYIHFPVHITAKAEAGIISKTHISDLLRLELLKRYGGTWIDATVLLTGAMPQYMLDSELFLFQNLKPGLDGHCTRVSSWFMTAEEGDRIISLTLALLYEYWRRNDGLADYYIFHDFFEIAVETYPEEWKKVVPFSNSTPHILLLRLFEQYDEQVWEAVKQQTAVHKLSYKNSETDMGKQGTYYRKILEGEK